MTEKTRVTVLFRPQHRHDASAYAAWFQDRPACWETGETKEAALENLRRLYPDMARQEWEVTER